MSLNHTGPHLPIDAAALPDRLRSLAVALAGREADDLVHRTLVRLLDVAPDRVGHVGYARRTMTRLWLDQRRGVRREAVRLLDIAWRSPPRLEPGIDAGERRAAVGTLVFAFGTVNWFSAIIGTTWFLSHLCAEIFLLLAMIEIFGKGRSWLVGASFGFAMLSRANIATAAPGVWLLLVHRHAVRRGFLQFVDDRAIARGLLFGLGLAIPVGIELWLNYARFGNPFDTGYGKASEIYMAGKKYGWYDWHYISQHVHIAIFKGWEYVEEFPFLKPSPEGLSIVLTSPVLLYAFAASRRDATVRLLWIATALTAAALVPYFYQGWVQFGYRYLLDALPYVIVLMAMGMRDREWVPILFLAEASALLNALGVYWGKKLGW